VFSFKLDHISFSKIEISCILKCIFEHINELKPLVFYKISTIFQAKLILENAKKQKNKTCIHPITIYLNVLMDNIFPYK